MSLLQLNQETGLELSTQWLTEENSIILQLLGKLCEGIIYKEVNEWHFALSKMTHLYLEVVTWHEIVHT